VANNNYILIDNMPQIIGGYRDNEPTGVNTPRSDAAWNRDEMFAAGDVM
jgi:hypothetical protein